MHAALFRKHLIFPLRALAAQITAVSPGFSTLFRINKAAFVTEGGDFKNNSHSDW